MTGILRSPFVLLVASLLATSESQGLTFTYESAVDVPVTAASYTVAGQTFTPTLNFAPSTGTELTVVNNTGLSFIVGAYSNLGQGQVVPLSYDGVTYKFVANYYGGTGNDLVLMWKDSRILAWGDNLKGQLGDDTTTNRSMPVAVTATGVLAGKTVLCRMGSGIV